MEILFFIAVFFYHFLYYQLMTVREGAHMEWYKTVISTWHHGCVVASGDLQNLNIFILKIAI